MGLSDNEKRIVLAIGQTMFPRDSVLSIDADDAAVVAWVEDYISTMPALPRGQLRALLNTFEYGYAAWSGHPRAAFTLARPAERAEYLESWERASTYSQRMMYEALRAMFTFAYVDSEPVCEAIGSDRPAPVRAAGTTTRDTSGRAAGEANK
ncbi:MAG: gluconate 2-dehydrogenase subunit 3 family protein [Myxococcota bacterium]